MKSAREEREYVITLKSQGKHRNDRSVSKKKNNSRSASKREQSSNYI